MGIYVWGTGCGAAELLNRGFPPARIKAWVDSTPNSSEFSGRPVLRPEAVPANDVELMIVTSSHTREIQERCFSLGIRRDLLFFMKNQWELTGKNHCCSAAKKLLSPALYERLQEPCHIIREPLMDVQTPLTPRDLEHDFARVKTLALLPEHLRDIPGAVAELGVYQGNFARLINLLFPSRRLYLFDSFQGFDPAEAAQELSRQTCAPAFVDAHKNTTAQSVLARMPHPEQVVLCEGYFPDSAKDLEECFAFVSLDADFETTTCEGLLWFWPRMSPGGCIFLHDYNSPGLSGVKRGLQRCQDTLHTRFPSVPLCDINGTLVLCKP